MNFSLSPSFLYFYQFLIGDIECYDEDTSKKDFNSKNQKNPTELLQYHDKGSLSIYLNNKALRFLPSEISNFKKLENCFLNHNKFDKIPSDLSKIKTLELLDMHHNRLKNFPNEFRLGALKGLFLGNNNIYFTKYLSDEDIILDLDDIYPKLEVLDLSHNKINWVPILKSTNLKKLNFYGNEIASINQQIFIGLTKLEILGLTFNNLKEINNNIGEQKNLEIIYLCGNQLKTFILDKYRLENLTSLDLSYNKITEFKLKQFIVPKIIILSLTGNGLFKIPSEIYGLKSLEILYLSCNNIIEISDSISNLTNLISLNLCNNKISTIPKSVNKLTNLKKFRISFEHLKKDYVPKCIIDIIRDGQHHINYKQYIGQKENSKTTKKLSEYH